MALLDVLSEELVFDPSNERDLQKPLMLKNSSDNNLVVFRLTTNKPPGLFLLDPPMGIVERHNTMVVSIIMDPNVAYATWEHYKLSIEALDVAFQIDLERFWTSLYTDDPWMKELELVTLDQESVDNRQVGADNTPDVMDLTRQFLNLQLKVENLRTKERNKQLNFTMILPLILVILGIWWFW
ncbi:uncharacterized protein [Drosophila kikkawai]|uniref:MSP domain-containing protein n=1 Tax=Drosophila kikkawai TaxID=30033 RepID=A0A6P4J4A5_DROKI|nr:uncharacterized protein LOC108080100 [Drosophila kikkawai]